MSQHSEPVELFRKLQTHDADLEQTKALINERLNLSKDPHFLNSLIDYYFATSCIRCLELIVNVCELQVKFLFDKISDCSKGATRLQSLNLLSRVVHKRQPWLHKISKHSLLPAVIKILKSDVEITHLMPAALVIVSLFPIIPSTFGTNHLNDLLEIFTRLAAFNAKNSANASGALLNHLNVANYSLFHHIYSLFPCNFLHYLRGYCSNKEHTEIFNQSIIPMLQHVWVNPMLFTCNRDGEISLTRWKHLETQDLFVECSKYSLDLNEGIRGDEKIVSRLTTSLRNIGYLQHTEEDVDDDSREDDVLPFPKLPKTLKPDSIMAQSLQELETWSPSTKCGLYTPPPQHSPDFEDMEASGEQENLQEAIRELSPVVEAASSSSRQTEDEQSSKMTEIVPLKTLESDPSTVQKSDVFKPESSVGSPQSKLHRVPLSTSSGIGTLASLPHTSDDDQKVSTEKQDVSDAEVANILGKVTSKHESCGQFSGIRPAPTGRDSDQLCQSPYMERIHEAQRGRSFSQGKSLPRKETVESSSRHDSIELRSSSLPNIPLETDPQVIYQSQPTEHILKSTLPQFPKSPKNQPRVTKVPYMKSEYVNRPLFIHLSPPEILDCYLKKCATLHEQKADLPHSSGQNLELDMKILKDEIQLLHTLVLFERSKREAHAERNRRLLIKANKVKTLEEEKNALTDQLQLLERDAARISAEMLEKCKETHQLMAVKDKEIDKMLSEKRSSFPERDWLTTLASKLQEDVANFTTENKLLKLDNARLKSESATQSRELMYLDQLAKDKKKLKAEIANVKQELVLMTDLNVMRKARVAELEQNVELEAQIANLRAVFDHEIDGLKFALETRDAQYQAMRNRVNELEINRSKKEATIAELKKSFQISKGEYEQQVKETERKYSLSAKICQDMESEILKLLSQMGVSITKEQLMATKLSAGCSSDPEMARGPEGAYVHLDEAGAAGGAAMFEHLEESNVVRPSGRDQKTGFKVEVVEVEHHAKDISEYSDQEVNPIYSINSPGFASEAATRDDESDNV